MKIGKYEITESPNIYWWVVTSVFVYVAVTGGNWWWLCGWLLFNATLIPICFWTHEWKKKKNL